MLLQVTLQLYPPAAADPVGPPVPAVGARYFNTVAAEWRWFAGGTWSSMGSSDFGQTITVAKSGANHTTFKAGLLAAAAVSTSGNRILVIVYAGAYSEVNPLVIPDYTSTMRGASRFSEIVTVISVPAVGFAPKDAVISPSINISLLKINSRFQDNFLDAVGGITEIPAGTDTSFPAVLSVKWIPRGTNTGAVELEVYDTEWTQGDFIDGTRSDDFQTDITGGLTNADEDEQMLTTFDLDIRDAIPGDILGFQLERDATAGNLDDTWSGNVDIAEMFISVKKWK